MYQKLVLTKPGDNLMVMCRPMTPPLLGFAQEDDEEQGNGYHARTVHSILHQLSERMNFDESLPQRLFCTLRSIYSIK